MASQHVKTSRYNIFVDYLPDDVQIAFNFVSGGMLVFDKKNIPTVAGILADPAKPLKKDDKTLRSIAYPAVRYLWRN